MLQSQSFCKVYLGETPPPSYESSIYLMGCHNVGVNEEKWYTEVLDHLSDLKYDGVVFIPDYRPNNNVKITIKDQIHWCRQFQIQSDQILCWVNRKIPKNPGLSLNIEFGLCVGEIKFNYGRDLDSERCEVLDNLYFTLNNKEVKTDIYELTSNVVKYCKNNESLRPFGETCVPLYIWNLPEFNNFRNKCLPPNSVIVDFECLSTISDKNDPNKVVCITFYIKSRKLDSGNDEDFNGIFMISDNNYVEIKTWG